MNPPPPKLPALGCVTASANPTATAASIALPPRFSTSTPASAASGSCATTIAWRARTGWRALRSKHETRARKIERHRIIVIVQEARERRLRNRRHGRYARERQPMDSRLAVSADQRRTQFFSMERPRDHIKTAEAQDVIGQWTARVAEQNDASAPPHLADQLQIVAPQARVQIPIEQNDG